MAAGDDLSNIEDPLDFNELSDHLVANTASANVDKDIGDVNDDKLLGHSTSVPVPITITIPPCNPATCPAPRPVKVAIPLRILFKYPTELDDLNCPWAGPGSGQASAGPDLTQEGQGPGMIASGPRDRPRVSLAQPIQRYGRASCLIANYHNSSTDTEISVTRLVQAKSILCLATPFSQPSKKRQFKTFLSMAQEHD